MEAKATLIWSDCGVELDTIAGIGLHDALVINPGHAEGKDTVRLDHALDNLCVLELGMLVINFFDGLQNFLYSLQVFAFSGILRLETIHNFLCFHYLWSVS